MDAVGSENISTIVGYLLAKGDFSESSPNLPQRIVILAEANHANQTSLDTDAKEITSAQQAGTLYGYGSPIHRAISILRPNGSTGIGGIPTIVIPQAEATGATYQVLRITPTGVATGNGTHKLIICGRKGMEAVFYNININTGDTTDDITAKIEDVINAVLGAPVIAISTDYYATLTSKWKGLTAHEINVDIDTGSSDLGISYAVSEITAGSGTPSIATALAQFGSAWNTIVINGYGTQSDIMDALEAFNGIPDPEAPTGRYAGIIMKPFIALTGSTAEDPSSITDGRLNDVTIAICPAPLSACFSIEAAANMCLRFARCSQDTPELDVQDWYYPDMPAPTAIGLMADYAERDRMVKIGCSTVDLVAGVYQVKDFVTTYHPIGETPPQFRYCRNLMLDFNVRYSYYLLEQLYVVDHLIANDNAIVNRAKVIKPKQWKGILYQLAASLELRGLIVDKEFMKANIVVRLSTSNPDRLDTTFKYKRSGFVRISSTTAVAGFNFGTLN